MTAGGVEGGAPADAVPAIELVGVRFAYPDGHPALDGVDLRVAAGERVAVLGPNGAGKSTLCLHLNGILTPGNGTVTISGRRVAGRDLTEIRRRVGLVFQDPDDQLFMPTVGEDVAFGPANFGLSGAALADRVERAMAAVGMTGFERRSPLHLSGGQRQRIAIARALLTNPRILILDEATSALDPELTGEVLRVLRALAEQKTTMIIVTHEMHFARDVADRILFMDGGSVVEEGPAHEVIDHPREERTRRFLASYAAGNA